MFKTNSQSKIITVYKKINSKNVHKIFVIKENMTVFYKASELSSKAKTQEGHFQSAF